MDRTEVVVIGGGATGVGVARDLAMRGVDVTLLERGGLGSGTSGRSHGLLHSGARYAEDDPTGARECLAENRILREIAGACVDPTGGLFVSLDGDDPAYFDEKRDACADLDIPTSVLSGDATRERVPSLSPRVDRAMTVPDAVVYPSRLVAATAASARDHGAAIHTHAPVEDVHVDAGTVTGVTAGGDVDGRVDADVVVNATGAWAEACAALAGVDVEMRPTKGVMVAVGLELDAVVNRCRPPADGDIAVPHRSQAILGTTSVEIDDPDEIPEESWEVERTVAECAELLPEVADCEPRRTYWGVRPLYEPDEASRDARGISRGFFLLDHADDGADRFVSVVGGKLTTYRQMAEATADRVCAALDVDAPCETATTPLPGRDDPDRLDAFVREFDAAGPADADVVGAARDGRPR